MSGHRPGRARSDRGWLHESLPGPSGDDRPASRRGDSAFWVWTLTGTNNGPGGTGNAVRVSGIEVWKIGASGLVANSKTKNPADGRAPKNETHDATHLRHMSRLITAAQLSSRTCQQELARKNAGESASVTVQAPLRRS